MKFKVGLALAMVLASASIVSAAGNLVQNGNFADSLSQWSSFPAVGAIEEQDYGGTGFNSPTDTWAVFGGGQQHGGGIWQNLSTVVGQQYKLTFTYGGWGGDNAQSLRYFLGSLTDVVTAPLSTLDKDWSTGNQFVSVFYTATGSSTMLQFFDVSPSSINADGILTNVVVQAVPGPEAGAGLAGLAMAGIGAFVIRRRQHIAA